MALVVLDYLGKKVFKKISVTSWYHQFKVPVLVIRNKKDTGHFSTS